MFVHNCSFRHVVAEQVDLNDRKVVGVLLLNDRLFGRVRNLRLRAIDGVAHIDRRFGERIVGIELDDEGAGAFGCV
jgi:hypothetical protein